MDNDKKEKPQRDTEDERLTFIQNFVSRTMPLKSDKWIKMMLNNEYNEVVISFLEDTYQMRLTFHVNFADNLVACHDFPQKTKSKIIYFIRAKVPSKVNAGNFRKALIFGNLSAKSIDDLGTTVEHVVLPLLNCPANQSDWTLEIKKEMQAQSQKLRNVTTEFAGNVINRTFLPMPLTISDIMEVAPQIAAGQINKLTNKMKDSLERIVLRWAVAIDNVISETPRVAIFKKETYPKLSHLFEFWRDRLANLENICIQMLDVRAQAIGQILEQAQSVYINSFKSTFENVLAALVIARDIHLHLLPLQNQMEKCEETDFFESEDILKDTLQMVCLVWGHSKYHCTNEYMSLLFILFHNFLISYSSRALDSESLFRGEVDDTLEKFNKTFKIMKCYRDLYDKAKKNLQIFKSSPDKKSQNWTWHNDQVFERFDLYHKRLQELHNIFATCSEFSKLEKIEISTSRGRYITREINKIFEEFNLVYHDWSDIEFDPLDPNPLLKDFQRKKQQFYEKSDILERKIAFQFEKALEECCELTQSIQLIQIGGSILHRPIIKSQIFDYLFIVINLFSKEVDTVKYTFEESIKEFNKHGLKGIPIDYNFPLISGVLLWLNKLRDRLFVPYRQLLQLDFPVFDNEKGQHTLKRFQITKDLLEDFESKIFDKWCLDVVSDIEIGTTKSILRKEDNSLFVNFDQELITALKDIKNLKLMNYKIPEDVLNFHYKEEHLWESRSKLHSVSECYNKMHETMEPCEFALIQNEMETINKYIQPSIETINWNLFEENYIENMLAMVDNIYKRVLETQRNLEAIRNSMRSWGSDPLYKRKDSNPNGVLNLDERDITLEKRFIACNDTTELNSQIVKTNLKLFFNIPLDDYDYTNGNLEEKNGVLEFAGEPLEMHPAHFRALVAPENHPLIRPYEEYVDNIVQEELVETILESLRYIQMEMENKYQNIAPIFEVKMELQDAKVVVSPSLDATASDGLLAIIETILYDILNMSNMIPRIAQPLWTSESNAESDCLETYETAIIESQDITNIRNDICKRVKSCLMDAKKHIKKYNDYAYIWTNDRNGYLFEFKLYGRPLTSEERDNRGIDTFNVKEDPPSLRSYKQQINKFNSLYEEVKEWPDCKDFEGWLRLNKRNFKASLLDEISKWIMMFKNDLIARVINTLKDMDDFIREAEDTLKTQIDKDNLDGLLKVISLLRNIDNKQKQYDYIFGSLREVVDMLHEYQFKFPETVYEKFTVLPSEWARIKKKSAIIKQHIASIKAYQVSLIERRIVLFDNRVTFFRDTFLKQPYCQVPCTKVYKLLDSTNHVIDELEENFTHLKSSAAIFSLRGPDQSKLVKCRKELKMIKQVWDYFYCITTSIENWKNTPWKNIDVEAMDSESKRFIKDLRGLEKDVRAWSPYIFAENTLKNLMASLRAVTDLQNPAIKHRHWSELMQTTKVKFHMDASTTLSDLLELNLHNYEEEVRTTVDKAVKEMGMEKVLRNIRQTWTTMDFGYEIHDRTKLKLLKASEEIIEPLEDHQVQLQSLLSSRYIAHFLEEVTDWQMKLSNADQVISSWFEVQTKWVYLESIFVGSEDIRSQLKEDTKRFDHIDHEFKTLIAYALSDLNVIRCTSKQGIIPMLDKLKNQLVLCEKGLNDYFDAKRLAFPRFYFVSSADLLDILSNGNRPERIGSHLPKLYDSLAKLSMVSGTKLANGMISKEHDEYVRFAKNCECTGKVESWLNRVTISMRTTLRNHFRESIGAYEQKPRHLWILDWPSQAALCSSQIWFSAETNDSFRKLEMGHENALKDYQKKQIQQLNALISLLLGDLTPGDRQKIMTVCTIDVHNRDIIANLIVQKIDSINSFQWQSQLRHRWDTDADDCFANICDAQFRYDYEYLGNSPRLVITPLTDRCYITLTQSLHLVMGGAPAGPAGTGKTETTKDLGRALGMMVYVFNCSEQMDYRSCENIHKGLAQTGAWGCFDEFNRISVEVLSVVAVQVKSIQDAIKANKSTFNFMGDMIKLVQTVGMFITMNPGYAGRTELPENLKALYRPCAMVVPDFALICEIMLVAEGFQEARLLARKFITLYQLCRELLSNREHYDWGLRAIKSVLVVAGSLRRSDPLRPEDQVLMRALRDFNIPKIMTDDVPVFMGLIGDLFPALNVPRNRTMEFESAVRTAALNLRLQPEDGFILKVVQLEELLAVRHSVFIIGKAGTGKTEIWRTLYKTYQNLGRKPIYQDLNPKAVTNDELFGAVHPALREWKDGLFSFIMREQARITLSGPKWIILDGDIDPMWIESLNTVMDDNKVLTLANNERIALTKEMRLLFEISNLRTATPATVSRAGILYINPQDFGWNPYVLSWINTREVASERSILNVLFEKYVPTILDIFKTRLKKIIPVPEIAQVQMTCFLLDCLLTPTNVPPECPREWYEIYFVFATIWGFGSTLFEDQMIDWRNEFHKWWINEFKAVRFPSGGTIFNYYVDSETKRFLPWSNIVPNFELNPVVPIQANLVNTVETVRIRYFVDILVANKHPVMLVGPAGCGKTVIMASKLEGIGADYDVVNVPFNFYTTSDVLQKILEKPLEKKTGRNYGPSGKKSMIYYVDDLNMPEVDTYGTVQAHTLIRQFMDYSHWYDKDKLTLKEIHNCQFVACMNPNAGSFNINPRLQRHFCAFALNVPAPDALFQIFNSILSQHLLSPYNKFAVNVGGTCQSIVKAAIEIHKKISQHFLPTATKFHYIFNMRDLSSLFGGMLHANGETCPNPAALIRLFSHETTRVYRDKLIEFNDLQTFDHMLIDTLKKNCENLDQNFVLQQPCVYSHYALGLTDRKYMPVASWQDLQKLLNDAQNGYNEFVGDMTLVLFEDAMSHVCRINRVLETPRSNALLIGVGGSGKQTLTKLACYISSLDVTQIQLSKTYSLSDLKVDLATLYLKAGLKSTSSCFLMTDAQVPNDQFLVLINDLLANGEIHDLFPDEEVENIIAAIANEVKQAGIADTKENCWKFFIDKVRSLLKVVLCFSPVGSTLRIRSRKFPAIINCTCINWFHKWPQEALESVSLKFLTKSQFVPEQLSSPISKFMAYVHRTVDEISVQYLISSRRYNYTTPKTFLELINLYLKLLGEKVHNNKERIMRLETGLIKLEDCASQADNLQEVLRDQEIKLKIKNDAADKLIVVVSAENEKVQKERNIASEEEKKVRAIEEDVTEKAQVCEEDLRRAQPALDAAQAALNTLNKNNLTELKSFGSPPVAVVKVCAAVLVLFSPNGKIPKDRSWKACKVMMGKADKFLDDLIKYDKEHIHPDVIKALQPYLQDSEFNPEKIISKSSAAAGLCAWVININKFHEVYLVVEPKQRALNSARTELKAARDKLSTLNRRLNELQDELNVIQTEFDAARMEKQKCQDEADATAFTINLAKRLMNGLATEKVRWRKSVDSLKEQQVTLPGDILLISCFISYVGCFTRPYRLELQTQKWTPTFKQILPKIPHSENSDPFEMICDDAQIAEWNNQGLPNDRLSAENAAILVHSHRYPLMIDPQLQGLKWIKRKYGESLTIVRLTQKSYLDVIERSVSQGATLLIENIEESIDPVLDSLLGRVLIKKRKFLKIGDKEIEFNPNFRLILQTKLANPHFKPELQAQTTLINFTVTLDGLEDQLLAEVVSVEKPDLERSRTTLTTQQNTFKINLKSLEDDILQRLSSAGENILEDTALVLNLERTKKTSEEIEVKAAEAKQTAVQIDQARDQYRSVAKRGSILYFILNDLFKVNPMYQFSLKAFSFVFEKAIRQAKPATKLEDRITHLIDSITFSVYTYTSRGLFENDKLIFLFQMTIQILLSSYEIRQSELDFLLRYPYTPNLISPVNFLSSISWGGINAISSQDAFKGLDKDIEGSSKRWQKFVDSECPEKEKLPGEWKSRSSLQKLCIMRALRPDRMAYAIKIFVQEKLGSKYVETRSTEFSKTFEESSSRTHIFFILSPGVDPLKDVEKLGKSLGYSAESGNFFSISLGQGQEAVAENAIDEASQNGYWVILQNIHLVSRWLSTLEKKMENVSDISHENYRLFLSAEPPVSHEHHILPQGIIESAIKITNEPPTGMMANLHKALDNFSQETLEMCSKEAEFKAILFSLCYFHSVVAERRKFGAQGWNRTYPFNVGDLTISVYVLYNYLEANNRVPWEDLRYLFGEIMYGGHITDDWDRRLCKTYLEELMQPRLLDGDLNLCPGFLAPPNLDYFGYHSYIDENLPAESPQLYGMHPNAEIGFLTSVSERLFETVFELQPRLSSDGDAVMTSQEEIVQNILEDLTGKMPEPLNLLELITRVEDRSPYTIVAMQECECMNNLVNELSRTLNELDLGLKGELIITTEMEVLMDCLYRDKVPEQWTKLAYPSLLGLQAWFADLLIRFNELESWSSDFRLPATVWIGGFFNPQSFLTAIMQQTARKNELPLDRMCLNCDVTKKFKEDISTPPREGVYISGLFMEGARWDTKIGTIAESKMKELFASIPVIHVKAVTQDKQDVRNTYECPIYRIRMRGPTYVWTFNLKTKEKAAKWTLAGVCMLLQP